MLRPTRVSGAIAAAMSCACLSRFAPGAPLPPGFVEEVVADDLTGPTGLAFSPGGVLHLWEDAGRVVRIEDGQVIEPAVIKLQGEVSSYWTRALTGFAFDPDFTSNHYVYLAYTVDWEQYVGGGGALDTNHDTFGRLVRYEVDPRTGTTIPSSRCVMIGETHADGFPVTFASHTQNTIVFAPDGSLLLGVGDGATMSAGGDYGQSRNTCCSTNTAEADGIIALNEQVGAFRAQLVDTHAGKLLRIDRFTGEGMPSNPWYDPAAPSAPRSRVWSLGMRNPYTVSIRPGTGSSDPAAGDPGVLVVGDIGWDRWERLLVVTAAAQNFGWPLFEGLDPATSYPGFAIPNLDAANPLGCADFFDFRDLIVQETLNEPSWPNPCDPDVQIDASLTFMNRRAAVAWRNSRVFTSPFTLVPVFDEAGEAVSVSIADASSPVTGPHLRGVATVAGPFYTGDKWPEAYRGACFVADAGMGWISAMRFGDAHELTEITPFRDAGGAEPVSMAFDPDGYALYFTHYGGVTGLDPTVGAGEIRRIVVDCNGNGVGDDTDIASGTSPDGNGNGIPDECELVGDIDGDGRVGITDLLALLAHWGACDVDCPEDLDGDDVVGVSDLLIVLAHWTA